MTTIPKHIAIVMDGNGRWAKERCLPRVAGHRAGIKAVRRVISAACQKKVRVLSLFAFSTENWQRPKQEVDYLMTLLLEGLTKETQALKRRGVSLRLIGDTKRLAKPMQASIKAAQTPTFNPDNLILVVAINYGGCWDITQAAYQLARDIKSGKINDQPVCEKTFAKYLCLHDLPPVDLFIRTSGELRISNFLLWQLAYAELYFPDILWPDFDQAAFDKALMVFANRQRRFGRLTQQKRA